MLRGVPYGAYPSPINPPTQPAPSQIYKWQPCTSSSFLHFPAGPTWFYLGNNKLALFLCTRSLRLNTVWMSNWNGQSRPILTLSLRNEEKLDENVLDTEKDIEIAAVKGIQFPFRRWASLGSERKVLNKYEHSQQIHRSLDGSRLKKGEGDESYRLNWAVVVMVTKRTANLVAGSSS